MKIVYLCGLPGSGKTTLRKNFPGYDVVSTDDYIEGAAHDFGMTYNEFFKEGIKIAEPEMWKHIERCISEEINFIFDRTNLSAKSRAKSLSHMHQIAKKYNRDLDVSIFVLTTPIETIIERNQARAEFGRALPFGILMSMNSTKEFPTVDEGFTDIYMIEHDNEGMKMTHTIGSKRYDWV